MKVQLGVRPTPMNGYYCIDFAAQPTDMDRVLGDPYKLDSLLDANEVSEMVVGDSLDYLPLQARSKALNHWLTKLSHRGTIVITGNDPKYIGHVIFDGSINIEQTNSIIYGIGKKSMVTALDNINIAMNTGQFVVENLKYNNFQYVVVLRRK